MTKHLALSKRLMAAGLALWGLSVGCAQTPRMLTALFYPGNGTGPGFLLVAARPLDARVLWSAAILWCISWAFVAGHVAHIAAPHRRRPLRAFLALFLSSPLSAAAFALSVPALTRIATKGAYHVDGLAPFLPLVLLQFVVSVAYSGSMAGLARLEQRPLPRTWAHQPAGTL